MKTTSLAICLLFMCASSFAKSNDTTRRKKEFKNTLTLSAFGTQYLHTYGYHSRILEILNENPVDEYSISMERKIFPDWSVGIAYAAWDNHPHLQQKSGMSIYEPLRTGSWEYMQNYKMVDIYFSYRVVKLGRHLIRSGAGVSFTSGLNTIIDTIYSFAPYGGSDAIAIGRDETNNYWGGVAFISYDYLLLHNRLAIGYKVQVRKYQQWYSTELDMGFSVKFNF